MIEESIASNIVVLCSMQQVVEISQDMTYWKGQPNEPSSIIQRRVCHCHVVRVNYPGNDLASFAPPMYCGIVTQLIYIMPHALRKILCFPSHRSRSLVKPNSKALNAVVDL